MPGMATPSDSQRGQNCQYEAKEDGGGEPAGSYHVLEHPTLAEGSRWLLTLITVNNNQHNKFKFWNLSVTFRT